MAELLTVAEQEEIGEALADAGLYPSTCVIQSPATGVDRGGAPVSGWDTTATVACRVESPSRQPVETINGGQAGPLVSYDVYIHPRSTVVGSTDRILVNGRTLYVVGDNDAASIRFDLKLSTTAAQS